MQLDVTMTGTPANLQIASDASIQDFRRYDIGSGEPLSLATHCDGQYSSVDHEFHEVLCNAPLGNGSVTLKGDLGLPGSHNYGLAVSAENVPASALVVLVQHAKKNLPADLSAGGTVRGTFSIQRNAAAAKLNFEGQGEVSDFRLASAANKAEIGPEKIPFVMASGESRSSDSKKGARKTAPSIKFPDGPHVEFGPFPVAIGRTAAPVARGWINRDGYNI